MVVFYRMCDIPSTNPSPIYNDDKFSLNRMCLQSFVAAFRSISPTVVFICDFCPKEIYTELLETYCPFVYTVQFTEIGSNETMRLAYKLAKDTDDTIFLFQECDYLYLPAIGNRFIRTIETLGIVSPYDHPDFYTQPLMHGKSTELTIVADQHYRQARRNTMTFGMTKTILKEEYAILRYYGYLDNDVWQQLREDGHNLYTPIPTFATHMVTNLLSPGVDWAAQMSKYV
jgi:hypothetical protein